MRWKRVTWAARDIEGFGIYNMDFYIDDRDIGMAVRHSQPRADMKEERL